MSGRFWPCWVSVLTDLWQLGRGWVWEYCFQPTASTTAQMHVGSSQSFSHLRWNTHHPLPSLSHLGNSLNCPFHIKEVNSCMVLNYVCPVLRVCLDFVCKHTTCALCKHWYTMWIPFSDQLKGDTIFSLKWYTERDGLQLHVVLLFSFWFCLSWCIYLSFPWVVVS